MGGGRRDAATGAIREFASFVPTPRAFEGGAEDGDGARAHLEREAAFVRDEMVVYSHREPPARHRAR